MANSPTYLPVYTLAEMIAPTRNDYLVANASGSTGDVKLITIDTLINTFIQEYMDGSEIDSSTITLYESLGWTQPT